jgi:hypothetical protein
MKTPGSHGHAEAGGSLPVSAGTPLASLARHAFVMQVDLNHEQQCLSLRLLLRRPFPDQEASGVTNEVWLRWSHVANMAHVEAFFFGRKLKPVGEHLDQVLELKERPDGCAIQLIRAGRVRIRTSERPILEAPGGWRTMRCRGRSTARMELRLSGPGPYEVVFVTRRTTPERSRAGGFEDLRLRTFDTPMEVA